jgi:hypothetical protein
MPMKSMAPFMLALALVPAVALAQGPDPARILANPVTETTKMMLRQHADSMVRAAELMPEEKYSFHPTPAQMTYGQLVAHIAQTNEALCGAIEGHPPAGPPASPTGKDSKAVLVSALKASFEHCTAAISPLTDAQAAQAIAMGPQQVPRTYFMMILVADWSDHYSTQASYLRMNDILPPTAKPAR